MSRNLRLQRLSQFVTVLVLATMMRQAGSAIMAAQGDGQPWFSTPNLTVFAQRRPFIEPIEERIQVAIGVRSATASLFRHTGQDRLPAILVAGEPGIVGTPREVARELSGVGYVTLAVETLPDASSARSPLLAAIAGDPNDLRTAIDQLAALPSVDAARLGVIGWGQSLASVEQLADSGKVSAAVLAGGDACSYGNALFHVRNVPVLIVSEDREECRPLRARFRAGNLPHIVRVDATTGIADAAWVDIYEFLGMYVEDAATADVVDSPETQIARIVDIMRVLNADDGVRGRVAQLLAVRPTREEDWEQARSEAALVAEAGNLLLIRPPPRGSVLGWQQRAKDFRAAAQELLHAIEIRDFERAQASLRALPKTCAACHLDHR
jgi:dienelactone hydrolase